MIVPTEAKAKPNWKCNELFTVSKRPLWPAPKPGICLRRDATSPLFIYIKMKDSVSLLRPDYILTLFPLRAPPCVAGARSAPLRASLYRSTDCSPGALRAPRYHRYCLWGAMYTKFT